jgi:hypothetical protein
MIFLMLHPQTSKVNIKPVFAYQPSVAAQARPSNLNTPQFKGS